MNDFYSFWDKVCCTVNPALACLSVFFTYLIFPDQCFIAWSIALWVAAGLDLLTRFLAIFIKSGGVWQSFKTKNFSSDILFKRTFVKFISYLVIQILAGLSMRLYSINGINIVMATIIYSFLFLREAASNLENLIEAGAEDLRPLLFWLKKKESDVFKEDEKG